MRILKERDLLREFGDVGLRRWGSFLTEEFLSELRGRGARKLYKEMELNDPTIGAILFGIRQFANTVIFEVEGGPERLRKQFQEDLDRLTPPLRPDFLFQALSFITYGFAVFEIVFETRGGLRLKKLAFRHQDSIEEWKFDTTGETLGCYQRRLDGERVFLPKWKLLHIVNPDGRGSPEGRSLLRNAVIPYTFKKHLQILEGIGIERDLCGLPVLVVPLADYQNPTKLETLRGILRQLRRDEEEGIILPKDPISGARVYELELLTARRERQFDLSAVIERYNKDIAHTLLADLILVGLEQRGSYALAREKRTLFELAIRAFLETIAAAINQQVLEPLAQMIQPGIKESPQLKFTLPKEPDPTNVARLLSVMTGAGVPWGSDEAVLTWLYHYLGISEHPTGKGEENARTP